MRESNIEQMIDNIIKKYIKEENVSLDRPLSLNVQFSDNKVEEIDELETFIEVNNHFILTTHTPYNINELRFELFSSNKLVIRSYNYKYYKQFWFSKPVVLSSFSSSFKNNVLELVVKKKKNNSGPAQI